MQITVLGASGKVGVQVVEQALQLGHVVIAVVHSHDPFQGTPGLIVKKADVYDAASIEAAIKGSEVVISTLGSWGTAHRNVLSSAMHAVIPAMQHQNITRIITLTGSGATPPSETASFGQKALLRLLRPFPAGKVFQDGIDHMQLLANSDLDWTTLRSPAMVPIGSKDYELSAKAGSPIATIHRTAVATALLDQIKSSDFLHQAPILHRKKV